MTSWRCVAVVVCVGLATTPPASGGNERTKLLQQYGIVRSETVTQYLVDDGREAAPLLVVEVGRGGRAQTLVVVAGRRDPFPLRRNVDGVAVVVDARDVAGLIRVRRIDGYRLTMGGTSTGATQADSAPRAPGRRR